MPGLYCAEDQIPECPVSQANILSTEIPLAHFLETVSHTVTNIVCPGSHYATETGLKFILPASSAS